MLYYVHIQSNRNLYAKIFTSIQTFIYINITYHSQTHSLLSTLLHSTMASKVDKAQSLIKLLFMTIFTGTLLLWLLMPTNTYKSTIQPKLRTKFNSTYFGRQGPNLLIYTFPILLMSVLGCVYLHLGKTNKQIITKFKKPMIVKGPLGIVSGLELGFFTMFIALLIWSLSNYINNGFKSVALSAKDYNVQM